MSKLPGFLSCHEVDVLVLGAGIAGTRAALAAQQAGARVAHAYLARGASPFVIGANVPLGHEGVGDTAAAYAADMLAGGYHLGDHALVQTLAQQSVPAFEALAACHIPFVRNAQGFRQRHLSGNRYARSVYVPQGTGQALLAGLDQALAASARLSFPGHEVVSLLADGNRVEGALLRPRHQEQVVVVRARTTIIALGGVGRLYGDTTYPADVHGDSFRLALEAGARLIDMEFMQFEPVVTVAPEGARGMEMPTAMLGDGAQLLNRHGERFMFRYNPEHGEKNIEKARMALCIAEEVAAGRGLEGGTVRFDTTVLAPEVLESYVQHCKRLRHAGWDPAQIGPLVRPTAHSIMGGIQVDATGFTQVAGLYACGEAAGGFHGASRIAGNGAGEAMAMGWVVGRHAAQDALAAGNDRSWQVDATAQLSRLLTLSEPLSARSGASADAATVTQTIRHIMDQHAGLFRDQQGLNQGLQRLKPLSSKIAQLPTTTMDHWMQQRRIQGLWLQAQIILRAARLRTESRGAHQRLDYPEQADADWRVHLVWSLAPQSRFPVVSQVDVYTE